MRPLGNESLRTGLAVPEVGSRLREEPRDAITWVKCSSCDSGRAQVASTTINRSPKMMRYNDFNIKWIDRIDPVQPNTTSYSNSPPRTVSSSKRSRG